MSNDQVLKEKNISKVWEDPAFEEALLANIPQNPSDLKANEPHAAVIWE